MEKQKKEELLDERQSLKEDLRKAEENTLYSINWRGASEEKEERFNFHAKYRDVLRDYIIKEIEKIDKELEI